MKIISKSFTLIELIIAVLIIFLIVGLFILIIKPGDYFQNTRDSKRIDDLKKLETILDVLSLEDLNLEEGLSNNTIYISLPDSSPTCSSWISQLMILPQNWQYRCSSNPSVINGQGWLPIDFSTSIRAKFVQVKNLPLDPINKPPYYYSYVIGGSYKLSARLENNFKFSIRDNGIEPLAYELGSNLYLPTPQLKLVLYLPFDEGTGTNVYDLSIYKHIGTLRDSTTTICSNPPNSNCPTWSNGIFKKAISFDGNNDLVFVSHTPLLSNLLKGDLTVNLWIYPFSNFHSLRRGLIGKFVYGEFGLLSQPYSPNIHRFSCYHGQYVTNQDFNRVIDINMQDIENKWSLFSFSRGHKSQFFSVYLNLSQASSSWCWKEGSSSYCNKEQIPQWRPPISSNYYLGIGNTEMPDWVYPGTQWISWLGMIDEVRIYAEILKDKEIKAIYNYYRE